MGEDSRWLDGHFADAERAATIGNAVNLALPRPRRAAVQDLARLPALRLGKGGREAWAGASGDRARSHPPDEARRSLMTRRLQISHRPMSFSFMWISVSIVAAWALVVIGLPQRTQAWS
jgi:hypothetical protein